MELITIRYGTPREGEKEMRTTPSAVSEAIKEIEAAGNTFLSAFAGPDALGDNGCHIVYEASDGSRLYVSHGMDCACVQDKDGEQIWEDPSDILLAALACRK